MPRFRHLFMLALAVVLLAAPAARSVSSDLVIGQLFAGGGNANAPYTNDFVELFNRGSTRVDLASWSVQYASSAATTWQVTPLSGSVPPGGRYLVQLASAAAVGSPLPTPDATGTTNLAVSGGKVALVRTTTALACGASPGSCPADPASPTSSDTARRRTTREADPLRRSATRRPPFGPETDAPIPTRTRATCLLRPRFLATRRPPLLRVPGRRLLTTAYQATQASTSTSSPSCRSPSNVRASASATASPVRLHRPYRSASPSPATMRPAMR
jgi:lamin tail-like protein